MWHVLTTSPSGPIIRRCCSPTPRTSNMTILWHVATAFWLGFPNSAAVIRPGNWNKHEKTNNPSIHLKILTPQLQNLEIEPATGTMDWKTDMEAKHSLSPNHPWHLLGLTTAPHAFSELTSMLWTRHKDHFPKTTMDLLLQATPNSGYQFRK